METKLFSIFLTKDEREALQRVAEAQGYRQVAPWLRRLIQQADPQRNQEAKQHTTAHA
jgi:hypothetical protein